MPTTIPTYIDFNSEDEQKFSGFNLYAETNLDYKS